MEDYTNRVADDLEWFDALTQAALEAGVTTSFAKKLIEEARVELDPNPPTADDLKILARRL